MFMYVSIFCKANILFYRMYFYSYKFCSAATTKQRGMFQIYYITMALDYVYTSSLTSSTYVREFFIECRQLVRSVLFPQHYGNQIFQVKFFFTNPLLIRLSFQISMPHASTLCTMDYDFASDYSIAYLSATLLMYCR